MDLSQLAASLSDAPSDAPLPVENWHPAHCGAMDLVIKADGSWWHEGSPMTRAPMVRLFSRILRKDTEGYVLVTPAEKISITVEDVPFIAVDFDRTEDGFVFRTNVGDRVLISAQNPITMRRSDAIAQYAPYILVRGGLEARLDRAPYYRLVDDLEVDEDAAALVLQSAGATFALPMDPLA